MITETDIKRPQNAQEDWELETQWLDKTGAPRVVWRDKNGKAYDDIGAPLHGFADPAYAEKNQNKAGRPPKKRDEETLERVQNTLDKYAETAVANLIAIANNDFKKLNYDKPLPLTAVKGANEFLLNKSIANEKEKLQDLVKKLQGREKPFDPGANEEEEDFTMPVVVSFNSKEKE